MATQVTKKLLLNKGIFQKLRADRKFFIATLNAVFASHHKVLRIDTTTSERRLFETHELWLQDILRLEKFEGLQENGVEEMKLAAHLAYWIKRNSPIIIMNSKKTEFENIEKTREIHYKYANEYSALTIAFDLTAYFYANRVGSGVYLDELSMDDDYVMTFCHFLKTKNVSPHGLFLILKSLYFNPITGSRPKA